MFPHTRTDGVEDGHPVPRRWTHLALVSIAVAVLAIITQANLNNIFVGFSLLGTFFLFLNAKPTVRVLVAVLAAAAVCVVVALPGVAFSRGIWWFRGLFAYIAIVGMFSLGTLIVLLACADANRRRQYAILTSSAVLLLLFSLVVNPILLLLTRITPSTLDLYLYTFDATLGGQPSFAIGRLVSSSVMLAWIIQLSYCSIPAAIAGITAVELAKRPTDLPMTVRTVTLASLLGVICYQFYPAAGPRPFFGSTFPFHPLASRYARHLFLAAMPLSLEVPRNAMPSLHLTWALLIWYNSRTLSRTVKLGAAIYVVLTALATLGTGEHYLADLVVAFPFSAAVQAVFYRRARTALWRVAVVVTMALTIVWMLLLRFAVTVFWSTPLVPYAFIVGTVVVSLLFQFRLSKVAAAFDESRDVACDSKHGNVVISDAAVLCE
jgi:hypothetical protein